MSEAPDPLEAELSALRPYAVSPDLRRGVAERLGGAAPSRARQRWAFVLAGGLAAACLAAAFVWWGSQRRDEPQYTIVPPAPPAGVGDSEPTLQAYRRALARSPEELDALLDRQAVSASEPNPELVGINAFTHSSAAMHALLGDD